MKSFRLMNGVVLALVTCLFPPAASAAQGEAFFRERVEPLLKQRCYECHSHAGKIKGGLALDSRSGWQAGGDHGPAIKPGDLEKSLLIKAVRRVDDHLAMPPKSKLPGEEIAILEEWVKRGAPDPRGGGGPAKVVSGIDLKKGKQFWAFRPVANPSLPAVKNKAWPLDPLDRFVLARIERSKLRPVADADRYTWLRRVSLDLTGLSPTPAEIQEFADDHSPQAFEKVVDRLLNSQGVWRALGAALARSHGLRRHDGHVEQRLCRACVALSRLSHQRLQCGQAVR
jgi:hypothetical protein